MVSITNIEPNISAHIPQPPHGGDDTSPCRCLPCWWVRPRPLIPPTLADAFDGGFCYPSTHVPGCAGNCHIPRATAASDSNWPVVSSADLFDEYERELADRPQALRDVKILRVKFLLEFPVVASRWSTIRDWLNATWTGETGRTKRNRFDSLNSTLAY